MKVAFISNRRCVKTKSYEFLSELIAPHSTIEYWWDSSPHNRCAISVTDVLGSSPDVVIIRQVGHCLEGFARSEHPNVVFIPTFDSCRSLPDSYWRTCTNIKVLAFSYTIHQHLQSLGVLTRRVQYFPDPARFNCVDYSGLRGFFGQRNEHLNWRHVRNLFENIRFERFTLHHANDPGAKAITSPSRRECRWHRIAITSWFENRADYLATLEGANFFIAPRLSEGIGLSFLEAMAMGMAVAASDQPTMNEYITHQINGYLCNFGSLISLDVSRFREVGKRARESIEAGHICWNKERPKVLDFVFEKTKNLQNPVRAAHFLDPASARSTHCSTLRNLRASPGATPAVAMSGGLRTSGFVKGNSPERPLVTVAVVVLNACQTFRTTIESILEQSYDNLELIVLDGASSDGTLDLIRTYDQFIDFWNSERDEGPYFAMNKAAVCSSGHWILFMNAGDWFLNSESISAALLHAPRNADFIVGHHVYRTVDGIEELHKCNDPEVSWNLLRRGKLDGHWLQGIPGHQATLTRVSLLREHGYDTTFRVAADHDFFYRMKEQGCSFFHCGIPLSVYNGGGFSAKLSSLCISEWERTCLAHSNAPDKVRAFFADVRAYDRGEHSTSVPDRESPGKPMPKPIGRRARIFEFFRKLV
jgi:Glycosyl transferase family 2/Glycosyl transferases group 1